MSVEKISQKQHLLRGDQENSYEDSYYNSASTYTKLQYPDHVQALTLPTSYETNFSRSIFLLHTWKVQRIDYMVWFIPSACLIIVLMEGWRESKEREKTRTIGGWNNLKKKKIPKKTLRNGRKKQPKPKRFLLNLMTFPQSQSFLTTVRIFSPQWEMPNTVSFNSHTS